MFTLTLLYAIILFVLVIAAFVIIYHILRYSLSSALGYGGALIFTTVFLFLSLLNYLSFQSLEAKTALPTVNIPSLLDNPVITPPTKRSNPW